jgi:transcriptional regulator with XRE-family HTH domain
VPELVRRLPYTEGYISYIKCGYRTPTLKFRATVCAVLNQSEQELFGEVEA